MPFILNPSNPGGKSVSVAGADYSYKYPLSMNLKPGSSQHSQILTMVMQRAQASHSAISNRFDTWNKIDETLTAFIPLSEKEEALQRTDSTKPVSTVVPVTYATMDTILTYLVGAFLQDPIFRYEGVSSEDTLGASLLEMVVNLQCKRAKVGLQIHTMFRDMLAYGFGGITPLWKEHWGYKTRMKKQLFGGAKKVREETLLFEGNEFYNIDPYMTFPDPQFSISDVQRGNFIGWLRKENLHTLLQAEESSNALVFNCQYLTGTDGRSVFGVDNSKRDKDDVRSYAYSYDGTNLGIDVLYMYMDIIPSQLKLGKRNTPEKWLFAVAADSVVIQAGPVDLDHNLFPVCFCASEYDGYSASPISRLELVQGMQKFTDFMFNSHMTNVRKCLNDMFVVDPELININDLRNPSPGKLIRLRKKAWGKGIDGALQQLQVVDITRSHMADISQVTSLIEQSVGAPGLLQGVMQTSGDRRSATEFRETKGSALSRLERIAWVASLQAIGDLAYMTASQTQQFMSQEQYAKIVGRNESDLRTLYEDQQYALVGPLDILVDYDVVSGSALLPTQGDANQWAAMFQIISANPQLASQFDVVRIFQYWAKLTGAKNLEDFIVRGNPVQTQVLPDEEVAQGVQAGNLIPIGQAMGELG